MKKYVLTVVLTLMSTWTMAAATGEDAKAFVEMQSAQILQELQANQASYSNDPQAFQSFIGSKVAPTLAFDKMTEIALGRHLQATKASGKFEAFRDAFRQLLIRVYSKNWQQYSNAQVTILGMPAVDVYQRARVRVQVIDNNGQKQNVEFALWYVNNTWKVYDATFENISLLSGYRNTFDGQIQSGGIDALIAKMQTMD